MYVVKEIIDMHNNNSIYIDILHIRNETKTYKYKYTEYIVLLT